MSSRGGTGVTFVLAGPPTASWEPGGSGEACGCPWCVGFGDADGGLAERYWFCLTLCSSNFCVKSPFPAPSHRGGTQHPLCNSGSLFTPRASVRPASPFSGAVREDPFLLSFLSAVGYFPPHHLLNKPPFPAESRGHCHPAATRRP